MSLPCVDCLCVPICKNKTMNLIPRCKLLNDWLLDIEIDAPEVVKRVEIFLTYLKPHIYDKD